MAEEAKTQLTAEDPAAPADPDKKGEDKQPADPKAEDKGQASDKGNEAPIKVKLPDGRELTVTPQELAEMEKSHTAYKELRPAFTKVTQENAKLKKTVATLTAPEGEEGSDEGQDPKPDKVTEVERKVDEVALRQDQEALDKQLTTLRDKYPDFDETDALVTFLREQAKDPEYTLEDAVKASDGKVKEIKAQAIAEYEAKLEEEKKSQLETGGGNTAHVPADEKPKTLREATTRAMERMRRSE